MEEARASASRAGEREMTCGAAARGVGGRAGVLFFPWWLFCGFGFRAVRATRA